MKIRRKILALFAALSISSSAFATNVDGAMSRVSNESKRDTSANMTHSHNADGSKRSKAEGQAIGASNRAELSRRNKASASKPSEDKKKAPLHTLHRPYELHRTHEFHNTNYAETCFTGDTLVALYKDDQKQLVPIREVEVGDVVFSCNIDDPESPYCVQKPVLATKQVDTEELVKIELAAQGEINATVGHRFYVYEQGWVNAEDLQYGDYLLNDNGKLVFVIGAEILELEEPVPVYDLKVEGADDDSRNYFVGTDRVLVHNCDIAVAGMPGAAAMQGGAAATGTLVRGWMQQVAGAGVGLGLVNSAGRQGKQERLRGLANDDKLGSADRGWLAQEQNHIDRGGRGERKAKTMRNPPGKDLAHERGREAAKGYGYEHSNLQNRKDHKTQHKYDNNGKKNKHRPPRK